jgi:hypothetical protein
VPDSQARSTKTPLGFFKQPSSTRQCDKQTLCGREHGVWMPVLECCSSFKNFFLLSTLLSAIAIQKSNSFPLSPSQNNQIEIFRQKNAQPNTKAHP